CGLIRRKDGVALQVLKPRTRDDHITTPGLATTRLSYGARQMVRRNPAALSQDHRALNHVLELTHIARPVITFELSHKLGVDLLNRFAVLARILVHKMPQQKRNIRATRSKWRSLNI